MIDVRDFYEHTSLGAFAGFWRIFNTSPTVHGIAIEVASERLAYQQLFAGYLAEQLWPGDPKAHYRILSRFSQLNDCMTEYYGSYHDKTACDKEIYALAYMLCALGKAPGENRIPLNFLPDRTDEERAQRGQSLRRTYAAWRKEAVGDAPPYDQEFQEFLQHVSGSVLLRWSRRDAKWMSDTPTTSVDSLLARLLQRSDATAPLGTRSDSSTPPDPTTPSKPALAPTQLLSFSAEGRPTLHWDLISNDSEGAYYWGQKRGEKVDGHYDEWTVYDKRDGKRIGHVVVSRHGVKLFYHYGSNLIFPYTGGMGIHEVPKGNASAFGSFHNHKRIFPRTVVDASGNYTTAVLAPTGPGVSGYATYVSTDGTRYETEVYEKISYQTYYRRAILPWRRGYYRMPVRTRRALIRQVPSTAHVKIAEDPPAPPLPPPLR